MPRIRNMRPGRTLQVGDVVAGFGEVIDWPETSPLPKAVEGLDEGEARPDIAPPDPAEE